MKILILGQGGREHALAWKFKQSQSVSDIFVAPGNPGTAKIANNIECKLSDIEYLLNFARDNKIDLTVVGPEYPLTLGIVDLFETNNLRIFGPSKLAAQLEGSKAFAKEIMHAANVPTAKSELFVSKEAALCRAQELGEPVVLKADGLAAGKGVCVCLKKEEIAPAIEFLFADLKCERVLLEQFLQGKEASFIVATDGEQIMPFAPAHDYKRIYDKDLGPNTGGMGTVCPTPHLTTIQAEWAINNVIRPVLNEMKVRGCPFKGFLYAGLMIDSLGNINVLEFNARLGDPETQSILPRLNSDLAEILYLLADKKTVNKALDWKSEAAVCLVLAADGYPEHVKKGALIKGLEKFENTAETLVFHAGTKIENDKLLVSGGRVLNVVGLGKDLSLARQNAYATAEKIEFQGKQLRTDIAKFLND